jgi:hypothetical protein
MFNLVAAAVAAIFGALGYVEVGRYIRRTGESPWGLPRLAWAAVLAVSLVFGVVLLDLATDGAALEGTLLARLGRLRVGWLTRAFLGCMAVLFGVLAVVGGVSGLITGPQRMLAALTAMFGVGLLSMVLLVARQRRRRAKTYD